LTAPGRKWQGKGAPAPAPAHSGGRPIPTKPKAKRRTPQAPPPAPASAPPQPTKRPQEGPATWLPRRLWPGVAVLLLVTVIAFSPAFQSQLLSWDDLDYVSYNKRLRSAAGLAAIWNPFTPSMQYYPLVFTSYWMEYRLWGDAPMGYHATNIALHLLNSVLVLALGLELGASAWAAFGAAAVFALHPTQVASVVWVAERKNTLSAAFYLLAFLLYLRHRRTRSEGTYAAALGVFAAALLSKSQTVTLPASAFLADWMLQRRGQLPRVGLASIAARLAPMLVLGVLAGSITSQVEEGNVGASAFRLPSLAERPFIAATAPWFYLSKFLVPVELSPMYPKWKISAADPRWWIGLAAWPLVAAAALRWRERIGELTLWGLAHFCIALIPVLGVIPFAYQQFTYVADHYLYLAIIGAGLALAVQLDRLAGDSGWSRRRMAVTAVSVLLLGGCAVQSFREAHHWRDTPTFWNRVLARSPDAFAAHYSMGHYHRARREWSAAFPFYRRAFELRHDGPAAFRWYAESLRKTQGERAALEACNAKLAEDPRFVAAHLERARSYEGLGNRDGARAEYQRVLQLVPEGSEGWRIAQRHLKRLRGGG
jgi:tetratricopeptide (TPR) repeat protein